MSAWLSLMSGIEAPVIQAPMAGVQGAELAAAVSNSGGLGSLPCAMLSPEALQQALETLRQLTTAPVNLNFFCHPQPRLEPAVMAAWHARLAPYFAEYGIDPDSLLSGAQRQPFSHQIADIIEPFQPSIVSFHFGLPDADLLQRVKGWGACVLSSATTLEEGRWLAQQGVDAVIAQGVQAGGHRGHFLRQGLEEQLPTAALVEGLAATIEQPVIAAGGIASPAQLAPLKRGGAAGVQLGSAYLLAGEATTSKLHRRALQSERIRETAITTLYTGRPARGIVTRLMRELEAHAPPFPLAANAVGALRAAAEARGEDGFSPLWCGEGAQPESTSATAITRRFCEAWRDC